MLSSETLGVTAERFVTALKVPRHLLRNLHDLHARQWRLEDETRHPDASPLRVAEAKRNIDACNRQRHRIINAIDASVSPVSTGRESRYYSETVGELCDRLLILDLKQRAVAAPQESDGVDGPASGDVGTIDLACQHLEAVVTQLIDDLAAGRAALPPRVGVKVYNGAVA